jgi:sugar-specific transcriptional regulator TrmB
MSDERIDPGVLYASGIYSEKDFLDLALKLSYFGITQSQSKLYLYLLAKKYPVRAGVIIKETGLHRADAYRTLRALASQGLIRLEITTPTSYSAVEPEIVLSTLLSENQNKLLYLKELKSSLAPKLKEFQDVSEPAAYGSPDSVSDGYYKSVSGREGYYAAVRELVRNSHSEVLRILSALGLKLTTKLGMDKEYQKAVERGVSIKIIADVNKENLIQAQKLSKIIEIRHLDQVNARFTVVDRKITIFGHKFDNPNPPTRTKQQQDSEGTYLVFSDPKLAEVSCFFFEHLWKISRKF